MKPSPLDDQRAADRAATCLTKQSFDDFGAANRAARAMRRKGRRLHPYRCPTCRRIHLTKS